MNDKVYEKNEFIVFKVRNGFIVYNTRKKFEDGHTHLKYFNGAKTAIDLVINKKLPKSHNYYFMTSLLRISNDEKYSKELEEYINTKKNKTKYKYRNKNKVSKKR